MGRAPCCDKANVKKGPWSPEEDATLKSYIDQNGTGGNWIALPQKIGLKRCGKSCRLRWLNYLRPNIKHGGFSEEEDNIICSLYISIGSRWSIIAAQLPGRTDNDIKNYWNTRLKKKLLGKQRKEQARRSTTAAVPRHDHQQMTMKRQIIHSNNTITSTTTTSPFVYNNNTTIVSNIVDHEQHGLFESSSQIDAPYWPDLQSAALTAPAMPSDVANQIFNNNNNNNNNVKNLLGKLGGKFDEQAPPSSLDMLANYHHHVGDRDQNTFLLGLESLQAELSELINYRNYQQDEVVLDADGDKYNYSNNSEGFYEFDRIVTGSSTSTSSASLDSASSSSFAYTPTMVVSDYKSSDTTNNYVQMLPHHQDYSGFDQDIDRSRYYFGTNYSTSSV